MFSHAPMDPKGEREACTVSHLHGKPRPADQRRSRVPDGIGAEGNCHRDILISVRTKLTLELETTCAIAFFTAGLCCFLLSSAYLLMAVFCPPEKLQYWQSYPVLQALLCPGAMLSALHLLSLMHTAMRRVGRKKPSAEEADDLSMV